MEIKERKVVTHDIAITEDEKNAIYTTNKILEKLSNYELEFTSVEGSFFDYDDCDRFSAFLDCLLSDDRVCVI